MKRQHIKDINTPKRYDEIYFGDRSHEIMPYWQVTPMLEMFAKGKVLDVGCGLGRYTPYFIDCDVTGVDFTQKVLDQAKIDYPQATFVNHDIAKNGLRCFEDNSFDFIFCAEVIEHMKEPDQLINEMHRVLKVGGICLTTTPYRDRIVCLEHLWEYDWQDLQKLFQGFERHSIFRYFNVPEADWEHLGVWAQK
jgi:ubiquinone/menaquinone biosynthesis C-methylase UbiE